MKNGAPRDEPKNGRGRGWVVPYKTQIFAETADFRRKLQIFAEIRGKPKIGLCHLIGDRDRGGQNVPNARGGGTRPESCPSKTWTFDLQIGDFL